MIWAIVGIAVICAICAMMDNSEKTANAQQALADAQIAGDQRAHHARRVEVLQRLLKEEFPEFEAQFTTTASSGVISAFNASATHQFVADRRKLFDKTKFKSGDAAAEAYTYMIEQAAVAVSQDFLDHLQATPGAHDKVLRVLDASNSLAG